MMKPDRVIEKFETYLKENDLKFTAGREVILREVLKMHGHFDSESLFTILKNKKKRVSRDAVFRNIPVLLSAGIIQKSVGSGKGEYYEVIEPSKGHHDHMICMKCEKVIEFFSKKLESVQLDICNKYGFKMTFHDHRIFGICKNCAK